MKQISKQKQKQKLKQKENKIFSHGIDPLWLKS